MDVLILAHAFSKLSLYPLHAEVQQLGPDVNKLTKLP